MKANYAVWTCSSLEKVVKSESIRPIGPVYIEAARKEHEAFQIVVRAGRTALEKVAVRVSDLSSHAARIPAARISVFLPAYVYLPKLLDHYPDPLPPYCGPFDLKPGQTQPIWIDVHVPHDARPGGYAGRVAIAPANSDPFEVPFTLRVYDFDLPIEPKLVTAFGVTTSSIANQHGVKAESEEARALHKKYYELLLDRGVSTYTIPADLFSDEGAKYLTDPRMTSFVVPYTTDEAEQRKILDRIRSLGAWDKGYFYFLDEPVHEDAYSKLKEGCDYLRKIAPKVNIVSPYFRNPDFTDRTIYDLLAGYINIWCFNTGFYHEEALDARRKAGDKIWNYVCCGPGQPYANFFVHYKPLEHRMLFWQNYLHQVSGLLYWSTTYWPETEDPWTNMATWGGLYGDGSLLYPGRKIGIDGPVSSIRPEVIRDGLEDYAYLWLLEQRVGREQVLPYVRKVTQGWTEYTRDASLFKSVRAEIAREIERLRSRPAGKI